MLYSSLEQHSNGISLLRYHLAIECLGVTKFLQDIIAMTILGQTLMEIHALGMIAIQPHAELTIMLLDM